MSGISGNVGSLPGGPPSNRMKISNMAALSQNLDTDALVDASVKAASVPLVQLEQTQSQLQGKQAIWGGLEKKLETFRKSTGSLHLEGNFNAFKPVTPAHSGFTVSVSDKAAIGHHDIAVESLARPAVAVSSGLADPDRASVLNTPPDGALSHGVITFLIGDKLVGGRYESVRIDNDTGFTLKNFSEAINNAHVGIHAMVMRTGSPDAPYSLSLSSTKNGLNFRVVGTEGIDLSFKTVQKAALARLTVDGVPVVADSNDVKDAVPGTVLHLRRPTGTVPVPVSIVHDRKKITANVSGFVKAYNGLIDYIDKYSRLDKMTGTGGPLLGSYTATEIRNRLGTSLTRAGMDEAGRYRTFADIGVTFEKTGRLSYNHQTFERALSSDYSGVVNLLAGSPGHPGLMSSLHSILVEMTNPANGPIFGEQSALNSQGRMNEKEIERKQEEVMDLKQRMEEKYSGLQSLLGGLNAKQNYINQQIARGSL